MTIIPFIFRECDTFFTLPCLVGQCITSAVQLHESGQLIRVTAYLPMSCRSLFASHWLRIYKPRPSCAQKRRLFLVLRTTRDHLHYQSTDHSRPFTQLTTSYLQSHEDVPQSTKKDVKMRLTNYLQLQCFLGTTTHTMRSSKTGVTSTPVCEARITVAKTNV